MAKNMNTYIILNIRLASSYQNIPAALIVAGLARQVQRREPATVLQVDVAPPFAQEVDGLAVAFPRRLV